MRVFYWALGLGGFALLVGAVSVVVFKNTAFRPQQKTTTQTSQSKNTLPNRLTPGLETLAELYKSKSRLVVSSSVHVVFEGRVRAMVPNSITVTFGEEEVTIANQNTQRTIIFVAASRDGKSPRKLKETDITVGDEVSVVAHLDLSESTWTIDYITKLAP